MDGLIDRRSGWLAGFSVAMDRVQHDADLLVDVCTRSVIWPAKLGGGDILADCATVGLVQALQPFPHWLVAGSGAIERRW